MKQCVIKYNKDFLGNKTSIQEVMAPNNKRSLLFDTIKRNLPENDIIDVYQYIYEPDNILKYNNNEKMKDFELYLEDKDRFNKELFTGNLDENNEPLFDELISKLIINNNYFEKTPVKLTPKIENYTKLLNKLKNQFGIKYKIVNKPNEQWAGRYKNNFVEINQYYLESNPDVLFHEFIHPLIDVMSVQNEHLFEMLKNEIDSIRKTNSLYNRELNRIYNDPLYSEDGKTLNVIGYKEAITELVGIMSLNKYNSSSNSKIKPIFDRIISFFRNLFIVIFNSKKEDTPLNVLNLTLNELSDLVVSDYDFKKIIQPKSNMEQLEGDYQYKKVEFPIDSMEQNGYTPEQIEIAKKYNENTKDLTGETIEVDVESLPDNVKYYLEKKGKKTMLYERKPTESNKRKYVLHRVSHAQDKIKVKYKTKEEALQEENNPASKFYRNVGTEMHAYNQNVIDWISENYPLGNGPYGELGVTANMLLEKYRNTPFYKETVKNIRNGNSLFLHKTYIDEFDLGETVSSDGVLNYEKLIYSMIALYKDAMQHQINLNNEESRKQGKPVYNKPIILTETPIIDLKRDEAGTMDFCVIYSDGTASIYDHKFIDIPVKKVEFKNPSKEELKLIQMKRSEQGYSTNLSNSENHWFYDIDTDEMNKKMINKRESYDMQLSRYSEMLTQLYGVKKIRQARIIPFQVRYTKSKVKNKKNKDSYVIDENSKIRYVSTIFDSSLNYLPVTVEMTGKVKLDNFIKQLQDKKESIKNEIKKKRAYDDVQLRSRLYILTSLIDSIKNNDSLDYVADYIKSMNNDIESRLKTTDNTSEKYLNFEDINNYLKEINLYKNIVDNLSEVLDELKLKDENKFKTILSDIGQQQGQLIAYEAELRNILVVRLEEYAVEKLGMKKETFDNYLNQSDISFIQKQLLNMKSINHSLVQVFAQTLDRINANIVNEQNKMIKTLNSKIEELKKWGKSKGLSGVDIYKDILGKDNNLIHRFNLEYFNEIKKHNDVSDKHNIEWFKENIHRSKEVDLTGKSDEDRFQEKLEMAKKQLKKRAKDEEHYEALLSKWLNENDITYNKGENRAWANRYSIKSPINPEKWYSNEYLNLLKPENKPLFDFYNFYIKTNLELNKLVDFKIDANFVANVRKDFVDKIVQDGITSTTVNIWENIKSISLPDQGKLQNVRDNKEIPLLYIDPLTEGEKSIDLGKNLLLFSTFVHGYKGMKDLEHIANGIREVISVTPLVEKDSLGNKKKDPINAGSFSKKEIPNSQLLQAFDDYTSHYIYGEHIKNDPLSSTLGEKGTNIMTNILQYSSRKNLAFNFLSAIAGHVNVKAQMLNIANKGKIFNYDQMKKATLTFERFDKRLAYMSEFFNVANNKNEKSNLLSISDMRKRFKSDITFTLQRWSDNAAENTILCAMMQNYGIDPNNGKVYRLEQLKQMYPNIEFKSLWDSIEEEDGIYRIKNQHTNKFIDDLSDNSNLNTLSSMRRKTQEVIGRIKGNMSNEDIANYRLTLLGRMLMQYRGWIPSTMHERLKKAQYNITMDDFEVGRWVAAFDFAKKGWIKAAKELSLSLIPFYNNKFDSLKDDPGMKELYEQFKIDNPDGINVTFDEFVNEYSGQMRALAKELKIYGAFILALFLANLAFDDEEERMNPAVKGLMSILDRVNLELGFYLPFTPQGFNEVYQLFNKTPAPMINIIKDGANTLGNTFGEGYDLLTNTDYNKTSLPRFGKDSWTFDTEQIRDNTPVMYYTSQWFGLKSITDMTGLFNNTDQKDTMFDYVFK